MVCVIPTLECDGLYAPILEWMGKCRNEDRQQDLVFTSEMVLDLSIETYI